MKSPVILQEPLLFNQLTKKYKLCSEKYDKIRSLQKFPIAMTDSTTTPNSKNIKVDNLQLTQLFGQLQQLQPLKFQKTHQSQAFASHYSQKHHLNQCPSIESNCSYNYSGNNPNPHICSQCHNLNNASINTHESFSPKNDEINKPRSSSFFSSPSLSSSAESEASTPLPSKLPPLSPSSSYPSSPSAPSPSLSKQQHHNIEMDPYFQYFQYFQYCQFSQLQKQKQLQDEIESQLRRLQLQTHELMNKVQKNRYPCRNDKITSIRKNTEKITPFTTTTMDYNLTKNHNRTVIADAVGTIESVTPKYSSVSPKYGNGGTNISTSINIKNKHQDEIRKHENLKYRYHLQQSEQVQTQTKKYQRQQINHAPKKYVRSHQQPPLQPLPKKKLLSPLMSTAQHPPQHQTPSPPSIHLTTAAKKITEEAQTAVSTASTTLAAQNKNLKAATKTTATNTTATVPVLTMEKASTLSYLASNDLRTTSAISTMTDPIYNDASASKIPIPSRIIQRKYNPGHHKFCNVPIKNLRNGKCRFSNPKEARKETFKGHDMDTLRILQPHGYFERVLEIFNCPYYVRNIHITRIVQTAMCAVGYNISANDIGIHWEAELLKKAGKLGKIKTDKAERVQIWFPNEILRDLAYEVIRFQGQMPYVEKAGHREHWIFSPHPELIDCNAFIENVCDNQFGTKGKKFSPPCPFRHQSISNKVCIQWASKQRCRKGKMCPQKHPAITILQAQEKMICNNENVKKNKVKKSKSSSTCIFWLRNFCQKGVKCPYSHAPEKRPCPFTFDLKCYSEGHCFFKHSLNHVVRHRMWTPNEVGTFLYWCSTKFEALIATFSTEKRSAEFGQGMIDIVESIQKFFQQLEEFNDGIQSKPPNNDIAKLHNLCTKSIDLGKIVALHRIRKKNAQKMRKTFKEGSKYSTVSLGKPAQFSDHQRVWEALKEVSKYARCLQKHNSLKTICRLYESVESKYPKKPATEPIVADLIEAGDQLFWMLTSLELACRHAIGTDRSSTTTEVKMESVDHNQQRAHSKGSISMSTSKKRLPLPYQEKKKSQNLQLTSRNAIETNESTQNAKMEETLNYNQKLLRSKEYIFANPGKKRISLLFQERKQSLATKKKDLSFRRSGSIGFREDKNRSFPRFSSISSCGKSFLIRPHSMNDSNSASKTIRMLHQDLG